VAPIGLTLLVAFSGAGQAFATTGPTHFLPNSKFKVASALEGRYVGQYTLKSVSSGARIKGGAMGIEVNNNGYLYGVGQFYGYDASGSQSTWTATLYNFRLSKTQVITFDLLSPSGTVLLGRIVASRAKSGDLSGTIQLSNGRFSIQWHKLSTH
jgi:hypothetical protein